MTAIRAYWGLLSSYLKPQKQHVFLLSAVLLLTIGLQLATPRVLRDFIDLALAGSAYAALFKKAVLFFALVLLTQLSSIVTTYFSERVAWTATNLLRVDLAEHCLHMDMSFHQKHPPGALIERVEGDVDALSNFFSQFLVQVLASIILLVGVLFMLFREDWRAGIGLSIFALLAIVIMMRVRTIGVPRWVALRQQSAEAFGFLGEVLNGTEDIRASGATAYFTRRFDDILRNWLPLRRQAVLAFSMIWSTTLMLFALGTCFAFGLGYSLWSIGAISAGTVYLIFNYTELMRQPIEQLRVQAEDLQRAGASVARVRELLEMQPKVQDGEGMALHRGALQVEFQDVTFRYGDDEIALHHVDFKLPAGSILGLLGRTGSGKSTIARLLFRLYDPSSGRICLDGIDIRSTRLTDLSRHVGLVPQEVQIFQASVRDNLTFFDRSVDDARILEILDAFELLPWLNSLSHGLDTELERGGGLSAGQAQLLNFARVALRDPGVIVLDEATSRLDLATEALIDRATVRLLSNRTGIVIAHRLYTVQKADAIMILEGGSIAEYGERLKLLNDPSSKFSALLQKGVEEVLQ